MEFRLQYLVFLLALSVFSSGLQASGNDPKKASSAIDIPAQDPPLVDSLLQITESDAADSIVAGAFLELASHFLKLNSARSFYYSQKAHDLSKKSLETRRYTRHEDSTVFLSIMAAALNRMGFTAKRRGEIPQSLDWHIQAAELSEQIGDSTHLSSALYNIGSLYFQLGEIEKTVENMERSLAIRKAMRDTALIASSLHATGSIYSRLNDYQTAQAYFEKAFDYAQQTGFERVAALSQYSLGTNFAKQGRFKEAIAYYNKSAEMFRKLRDHAMLV
ncbi:MAG: tetratricopeptide repeat protein, partial [Bacteroidota bacterium]